MKVSKQSSLCGKNHSLAPCLGVEGMRPVGFLLFVRVSVGGVVGFRYISGVVGFVGFII
jgi:hypothetical protein